MKTKQKIFCTFEWCNPICCSISTPSEVILIFQRLGYKKLEKPKCEKFPEQRIFRIFTRYLLLHLNCRIDSQNLANDNRDTMFIHILLNKLKYVKYTHLIMLKNLFNKERYKGRFK